MKKYLSIFLLTFSTIFAQEKPLDYVDFFSIEDIDFSVFENREFSSFYKNVGNKKEFLNQYFKVWNNQNQSVSDEIYKEYFTYKVSKSSPCISENLNPLSEKITYKISENINIKKSSIGKNIQLGISIKTVDIRFFPTDEVCFKKVRNAGEGFPFDYLQNSILWIATPVSILAKSNDGLWYFINSHNNKGWVKAENIAMVSKSDAEELQQLDFYTPIDDKIIVKGEYKNTKIFLGSIFPTLFKNNGVQILIPKKADNNVAYFEEVEVSTKNFKRFPIEFNAKNVKHILSELYHHKYTWGGLNEGRDCSSTLKDFFTPFGLWLPRDSGQQKNHGKVLKLEGSNQEKLSAITRDGIPFLSTIYKRGHIVLYLGLNHKKKPIIFQNVWGIKAYYKDKVLSKLAKNREKFGIFGIHNTKGLVNTRFNIGKAVVTNIEPSERLNRFENLTTESFLENFNTLTLFNFYPTESQK